MVTNNIDLRIVATADSKGFAELEGRVSAIEKKLGIVGKSTAFTDQEKKVRGFAKGADHANTILSKIKNVFAVFLLYKGFVFLQTQVADFIRELVSLEHELAIVQTQLTGLGKDFRPEIREQIFKISQETGISPSELAKAQFEIVSANIDVADSYEILRLSAMAAVAGNTEVSTAFNAGLSQINALELGIESFNEVYDKHFNLVKRGIFTYEEFASKIARVTIAGSRAGQDLETINAAIAAISQIQTGPQIEVGLTEMRNMLLQIATESDKVQETFGVSVADAEGNFRNLLDILNDIKATTEDLSEVELEQAIAKAFPNIREAGGVVTLMRVLPQMNQFMQEQASASGDMTAAFNVATDTLKAQAGILKNNLLPLLVGFTDSLTPLLAGTNELIESFNKLGGRMSDNESVFAKLWRTVREINSPFSMFGDVLAGTLSLFAKFFDLKLFGGETSFKEFFEFGQDLAKEVMKKAFGDIWSDSDVGGGSGDSTDPLAPGTPGSGSFNNSLDALKLSNISFAKTLFDAADAVQAGIIDGMGFTGEQLRLMGEEAQEFNRLLRQSAILTEIQNLTKFASGDFASTGFESIDSQLQAAAMNLLGMMDSMDISEFLSNFEIGEINLDKSTNNNFVIRITGDVDPSNAASFADNFIQEVNRQAREATAS